MTEWTAQIHLSDKVFKTIKWFTKNFDNEVGAIGIGEIKGGMLYVEKLFFPTQIVNGMHVHFKPEDWGPLMTEMKDDEWQKVIFYWHKHPDGSAKASPGDEDDTIDVFMDETSGRKIFGFLQTCNKDGKMDYEARIEQREPIWTTISDVLLVTDEDEKIEKACQKIIKEKITEGTASASEQPGWKNITNNFSNEPKTNYNFGGRDTINYDSPRSKAYITTIGSPPIKLSSIKTPYNIMSDLKKKSEEEYGMVFDVEQKNGNIKVQICTRMEEWIDNYVNRHDLKARIAKVDKKAQSDETIIYNIQTKKKCLDEVYTIFKGLEEYFWEGYKEIAITNASLKEIAEEEEGDHQTKTFNTGFINNKSNPDPMYYRH